MQLSTTRFGTIEIDPEAIITFTQPILGFQEFRRFVLLPGPSDYLRWLQSTDAGDLAFILMDPRAVAPDYKVEMDARELAELAATRVEEIEIYTLVVVPQDPAQTRTNLKAPILINLKQQLGKQTILEGSDWPIQHFLARAQRGETQAQEVGRAGSNA
jgi:flagellar assembly factor FliW